MYILLNYLISNINKNSFGDGLFLFVEIKKKKKKIAKKKFIMT